MRITYLIGNGFDLACGLQTRYTDVYEKYCVTDSPNENIENFKKDILTNGYENWTDFEMALPRFGKELNNFEKFKECILDFRHFLEDYLKEQEDRINIENSNANLAVKMQAYLYYIYEYCLKDSKAVLEEIIKKSNENVICDFITFNYTDTLEKCLSSMSEKVSKNDTYVYRYENPIHIHGALYQGILLGLDKEELYKDIPCADTRKLKNLIDKVYINSRYSDITDKSLAILKQSRVIVIFGWSMGESDNFWVENVKKCFSENSNLQLVYVPYYPEAVDKSIVNQPLDREDEQKDFIVKIFEISEEDKKRIHIVTDTRYMNLDFLSKSNREEKELVLV